MSVVKYWHERLEDGFPLFKKEWADEQFIVRYAGIFRGWPDAISRNGMYYDYLYWLESRKETNRLPSRSYHIRISELVFCNGPKWHITLRRVEEPTYFEGTWFDEQRYQRFIKLATYQEHVAHFERVTGLYVQHKQVA